MPTKKVRLGIVGTIGAAVLVTMTALPAAAMTTSYGAHDCGWPTHAYVEGVATNTVTLKITGTAGTGTRSGTWNNGAVATRHYVNSPNEDQQSGSAYTNASRWVSQGYDCSL